MKSRRVLFLLLFIIATSSALAQKLTPPAIAPALPPIEVATREPISLPPPPSTSEAEFEVPGQETGIYKWGIDSDASASLLLSSAMVLGGRFNILLPDPWQLGTQIGLAEDALEFKTGLGLAIGQTSALPLFAEAVLYLKEKSFYNLDPYVGVGLNYTSKLGSQIFAGVLYDLGIYSGQLGIEAGYQTINLAATQSQGFFLSVIRPIRL
ncbi:hypothetical protein A3F86_01465 [candidate division WOR-1 bacterium RIFCSPLOWO2_12_FULL_45_9]|uniref:Outer membrane protein beta-barrel domain-containing protein n=1 Tax=candidate division WOR-1 bacterium RIFCSPLOWO2_12_FULL_45_9 TaxID=1802568 RepID=A0A1F4RLS8_UNCSA|nr:MAG: hypothetical protein A3F86_01465 [candidate division WOR-1 bacterium RIFCSPLOWO2_12_FULL_45_9]